MHPLMYSFRQPKSLYSQSSLFKLSQASSSQSLPQSSFLAAAFSLPSKSIRSPSEAVLSFLAALFLEDLAAFKLKNVHYKLCCQL